MPSRSMNAPKSVMFFTRPLRTSPFCSEPSSSALLRHRALDELAARDDEIAALVGNLDDLELERLTDVGLELLDRSDLDLRTRQERLDVVDLDDETAADGRLDRARDDTPFDVTLQNLLPADLVVRTLLRELDHAGLVILELDEHDGHLVADLDRRRLALAGRELVNADDANRLVTDVDANVVTLDRTHGTFNEVAVLELGLLTGRGEHFRHRRRLVRRSRRLTNSHI